MYIIIFKNGAQHSEPLTKKTIDAAFALDGDKFVFSYDRNYELYQKGGIYCYEEIGAPGTFNYKGYELIQIKSLAKNVYEFTFHFEKSVIFSIALQGSKDPFYYALHDVICEIILASKFDSWDEYNKMSAYNSETKKLKKEVEKLTIENSRLNQEIENLKFLS